MHRPPPPPPPPPKVEFDIDRELNRPEDEFFGLTRQQPEEDAEHQGPLGRLVQLLDRVAQPARKLGERLRERSEAKEREQEIAEFLATPSPDQVGQVDVFDPDLEKHITVLAPSRDIQEFMEAERESTLFESYTYYRDVNVRFASRGLWLAGLVFLLVGLAPFSPPFAAMEYLDRVVLSPEPAPAGLVSAVGEEAARGSMVVIGLMAPLIGWMVLAHSLGELLAGVWLRLPRRALPSLIGVGAVLISLGLLASSKALAALVLLLIASVAMRMVASMLKAAGVQ